MTIAIILKDREEQQKYVQTYFLHIESIIIKKLVDLLADDAKQNWIVYHTFVFVKILTLSYIKPIWHVRVGTTTKFFIWATSDVKVKGLLFSSTQTEHLSMFQWNLKWTWIFLLKKFMLQKPLKDIYDICNIYYIWLTWKNKKKIKVRLQEVDIFLYVEWNETS